MGWEFWRGPQAVMKVHQAVSRSIHETLEYIGEEADAQVPKDEGTLQESKYIDVSGVKGVISYGGGPGTGFPVVPYAVRWHEKDANFQDGRKKRYLADPLNDKGPQKYEEALKKNLGNEL